MGQRARMSGPLLIMAFATACASLSAQIGRDLVHRQMVAAEESMLQIGPPVALPVTGLPHQVRASASPDSPDTILVCSYEGDGEHARNLSAAYVSLDAGNTWVQTLRDTNSDHVSELSCATGVNDRAYFVAGVADTSEGPGRLEAGTAEIYRSLDGGLTWTGRARYPFIDWTALAVGPSSTKSHDRVYLFGNLMAAGVGDAGEGGWQEKRGPVLVSDDGLHFSVPRFLPDQWDTGNLGALPVSAIALENGSALVLYDRSTNSSDKQYHFRLYKVDGRTYEPVSNVDMPGGLMPSLASAQMALDRSGRFHGRLYIAFSAIEGDRTALGLATSNDNGRSWHSRVLLEGDLVKQDYGTYESYAGVAVNKEGTVGIEWQPPMGCPLFLVSNDGGASVSESQNLGRCGDLSGGVTPPLEVAGRVLALNARGPVEQLRASNRDDPDGLPGFMLRVDPTALWDIQIVADAAGRFHAFWSELQPDGNTALLTATIRVNFSPPDSIQLRGIEDLTAQSLIKVLKEKFDPSLETFSIDAVVENATLETMAYPSILQVAADYSDCGVTKYLNSTGTSGDGRAVFRLPARPDRQRLFFGEMSLPVHLEISVEGCKAELLLERSRSAKPNGEWFYPLSVRFRVFAENQDANSH